MVSLRLRREEHESFGTGLVIGPRHVLTCGSNVRLRNADRTVQVQDIIVQYSTGDLEKPELMEIAKVVHAHVPFAWVEDLKAEWDLAFLLLDKPIGLTTGYLGVACVMDDTLLRFEDSSGREARIVEIPGYPLEVFRPLELAEVRGLNFKIDGVDTPAIVVKDVRFGKTKPALLLNDIKMTDLQLGSYVALEYHSVSAEKYKERWKVKCPVPKVSVPEQSPWRKFAADNIALIKKQIQSPESIDDITDNVTDSKEAIGVLGEKIDGNDYQFTQKRCLKNEQKDSFEPVTSNFLQYTLDATPGCNGCPVLTDFVAQNIPGTFVIAVHASAVQENVKRAVRITPVKFRLVVDWLKCNWDP